MNNLYMCVIIKFPTSDRRIIIRSSTLLNIPVLRCVEKAYYPFSSISEKVDIDKRYDLVFDVNEHTISFYNNTNSIYWNYNNQRDLYKKIMRHIQNNLLINHDFAVLHGCSLRFNDKTIILLGKSGEGKTTLAAYLNFVENMNYVAEDFLIINLSSFEVYCSGYSFRIRKSSLRLLKDICLSIDEANEYNGILDRYIVQSRNIIQDVKTKIDYIFILSRKASFQSPKISFCETSEEKILYNVFSPYSFTSNLNAAIKISNRGVVYELFYNNLEECGKIIKEFISTK